MRTTFKPLRRPATRRVATALLTGLALAVLLAARPAHAQYAFTTFDVTSIAGATNTNLYGINDLGQLVGSYQDANMITNGFVGTAAAQTTVNGPAALSSQTNPFGEVNKINNAGVYAGDFEAVDPTGANAPQGFTGSGGTAVATGLGNSQAFGINNPGDTVGAVLSGTGTNSRSYLQSRTGVLTVFDVTGFATSDATAINDSGVIVGQAAASTTSGPTVSYVRSAGATPAFSFLNIPGAFDVFAKGINNAGAIVGGYDTAAGGAESGFVFSGGILTTLTFPAATFTEADGVNSLGQIVGTYFDAGGAQHGFIAAPVPEASTVASLGLLLCLGFGGMALAAKRKQEKPAA